MYVTCGRQNDLSSGDGCWNGVGVGFANPEVLCSLETNLWPCGSESKSFISSHCSYARLEGWGGGVSGAGAAVCPPLLWLGFLPHTCIYSRGLSRRLQGSREKVDGRNPTELDKSDFCFDPEFDPGRNWILKDPLPRLALIVSVPSGFSPTPTPTPIQENHVGRGGWGRRWAPGQSLFIIIEPQKLKKMNLESVALCFLFSTMVNFIYSVCPKEAGLRIASRSNRKLMS